MNPLIAATLHLLKKKRQRERRCRACGNRQAIGENQTARAVTCRKCGKPIPPAKS